LASLTNSIVIGGSGFLGSRLTKLLEPLGGIGTFNSRPFLGGTKFDITSDYISSISERPRCVFVVGGAIEMDGCARDPERTALINVQGSIRTLKQAIELGSKPIFISTDYVFDGESGDRTEQDKAVPRMEYGRQKLAVENWLKTQNCDWLIIRLSKVVSGDRNTHSTLGQWVNAILAGEMQKAAIDQVFSPAHVDDVAGAIIRLAKLGETGLFHLGGPKAYSRYSLFQLLIDKIIEVQPSLSFTLEPCRLHDFPFLEQRPLNTSLSIEKLQKKINWPFRSMDEVCTILAREYFS
tara:strand:+ start:52962 stop:53843 length:882 start_codon:yes stop_codon:yes gene_type:complete